ncbi:arginine--tRNA ligase [soil metagenome]
MNLFQDARALIAGALDALVADGRLPAGLDYGAITVEPPRDPAHGEMATNAAMVLARPARMAPRDIAAALAGKLAQAEPVASAEVAGPGFLNIRLRPAVWFGVLPHVLAAGTGYGGSDIGAGRRVNIEFVSANPTGPMHVGHMRGAIVGDALARLLSFADYDVTREYYINDGGAQVDTLARSAYRRYLEALGEKADFLEGTYPGDYLIPVGQALAERHGRALLGLTEEDWLPELRDFAVAEMMALIREDLALIGVEMDVFFSEKSLSGTGAIEKALAALEAGGLIYEGVLEPPKGRVPEDWEPREQTLFRSTAFGDDVDRPVRKSDGAWTYFAPDIAYHWDKLNRGYDELIDVLGADHGGYVKRLKAVVGALSGGKVPLDVKLYQLVRLLKNGEPFKMSKRAGTYVTLRDVVEQFGPDVARFVMLTRKNDAPLDFDFDRALEQSRDNPVFYVHYAHARCHSVLARAAEAGFETDEGALVAADLAALGDPRELRLVQRIAEWPRQVELAAASHEPHRIVTYLSELAGEFHSLQHQGKLEPGLRFLREDAPEATRARLALVRATQVVMAAGLAILGVIPMDEMR